MKRVTVTMPGYLYSALKKKLKPGQVSDYVVNSIESQLGKDVTAKAGDPWGNFIAWRKKLPKYSMAKILEDIHKGRE